MFVTLCYQVFTTTYILSISAFYNVLIWRTNPIMFPFGYEESIVRICFVLIPFLVGISSAGSVIIFFFSSSIQLLRLEGMNVRE